MPLTGASESALRVDLGSILVCRGAPRRTNAMPDSGVLEHAMADFRGILQVPYEEHLADR